MCFYLYIESVLYVNWLYKLAIFCMVFPLKIRILSLIDLNKCSSFYKKFIEKKLSFKIIDFQLASEWMIKYV